MPKCVALFQIVRRSLCGVCLFLSAAQAFGDAGLERRAVLATIKPLQLIAAALTDGVKTSNPVLLLEPGTSPHDYALRPSDIKHIARAGVIFRIGDSLEHFLDRSLKQHAKGAIVVDMQSLAGMRLLSQSPEQRKSQEREARTSSYDPHLWLDPENVRLMAQAMTRALQKYDPTHASTYRSNCHSFEQRLIEVDNKNRKVLQQKGGRALFVFHDAWGYFTSHYRLSIAGTMAITPEQQPGARHIQEIRNQIERSGKACLFREPQFRPRYLDAVTRGLDVDVIELDPLASDIAVHKGGYFDFLAQLTERIKGCLASP